jgi:hypothetical protein
MGIIMNGKRYNVRWKIFGWELNFHFFTWNKKKYDRVQKHMENYIRDTNYEYRPKDK